MRTIIAGSRTITDYQVLLDALAQIDWTITTVVSGTAKGADLLGERWAKENGIPIERYPADWTKHGKSAGYRRNVEMAKVAEACIVLWDGRSLGATHMARLTKRYKIQLLMYTVDSVSGFVGVDMWRPVMKTKQEVKIFIAKHKTGYCLTLDAKERPEGYVKTLCGWPITFPLALDEYADDFEPGRGLEVCRVCWTAREQAGQGET